MRIGHQRELTGIAIPDLQVFVVQDLEGVARADLKQVPRKPFDLAAIAGKAESDAALALLGHGVVQIEKLAIADQVLSVGLREFLFRVIQARLRHLGCELGSDRVPVCIDDCWMFRCAVHFMCLLIDNCSFDKDRLSGFERRRLYYGSDMERAKLTAPT